MFSKLEEVLLCHFDDDCAPNDFSEHVKLLWSCDWILILQDLEIRNILSDYIEAIKDDSHNVSTHDETLCLITGITTLNLFCEINLTGPNKTIADDIKNDWPAHSDVVNKLIIDGEEIYSTILHPELLLYTIKIFDDLSESNLLYCWWKLRCYYMYQKILEERSHTILSKIENIIEKINEHKVLDDQLKLKILLHLELNQVYLTYGKIQNSNECLITIRECTGFNLELSGALGKRTKFQQKDIAQLGLKVTMDKPELRSVLSKTDSTLILPEPLKLGDDLRLENIHYLDPQEDSILTPLEQTICLNTLQYTQRSQPKDSLADEELYPYLNVLLTHKYGPWSTRLCALLIKCKIESNNKRTVERSMMQCEEIVNSFNRSDPKVSDRLSWIWTTGLPLKIHSSAQLADLLLSIGLIKAALDLYLKLHLWEEVIACYTILELRHKAAEIIQQQIDIKPTAKLYCLLGDATDDVGLYEKAWIFSNQKSSKAQRHWGNFLFSHKKYEECIPHYEKSCEINSLQECVWLRLGYAALSVNNWELAATAYRRYTYLEPNSFEAWNNLAKVYVKQGNKQRAYKALSEALKYNYDNWKVWENFIIVSIDTGHYSDVIRGYHRVLDLCKKHLDVEVLSLLVKAVLQNLVDADGNEAKLLHPKLLDLFGRITAVHASDATLWQLYADISPKALLRAQRFLRSYAAFNQTPNWFQDINLCEKVYVLSESIANNCLEAIDEENDVNKMQITELLSSTRLTVQTIIRVLSREQPSLFAEKIQKLQTLLETITTHLKTRMS